MFVTVLFSQYICTKVLNYTNITVQKYISGVLFSFLLAPGIYLLRDLLPYFRFVVMILFLTMFLIVILKTEFIIALTSSIVSTGISYSLFLFSAVISSSLIHFVHSERSVALAAIITIFLQGVIIICLFKIKKFKKGVTFIKSKRASALGLVISGVLLLLIVLVNRGISAERAGWVITAVALCVVGLIVWWRHGLTKQYREKVKERNIEDFERIIAEMDQKIKKLQEDNEMMSSVIHRDNKLLPSLANKVNLFMKSEKHVSIAGKQILKQIEQLFEERSEIIKHCTYNNATPQSLMCPVIDGVLNHMMMRASEKGVRFESTEINDFAKSIESTISSIKLQTLLADLIENAINVTEKSETKRVFVSFCIEEGIHEIHVQDSGRSFEAETLLILGIKKTSTRADEGGSGIGFMTIFEILRECNASLIITEYGHENFEFTKSITVRFDDSFKYIVMTGRAKEIKALYLSTEVVNRSLEILPI